MLNEVLRVRPWSNGISDLTRRGTKLLSGMFSVSLSLSTCTERPVRTQGQEAGKQALAGN